MVGSSPILFLPGHHKVTLTNFSWSSVGVIPSVPTLPMAVPPRPCGRPPGRGRGRGRGAASVVPSARDIGPQTALAAGTVSDTPTPAVKVASRPRGRPPGSGRGRGNSQLTTRKIGDPQPTTDAAEGILEDNLVRPHRTSGKYKPGESIVDNAPRRTSEEVLLAKQQAQKKVDDLEAAAIALKRDQQRKIAGLEDDIRRQDDVILERSHRPDLFDLEITKV